MQQVQVFIPSELLTAGEAAMVYGPDATGALDTTQVIRGGRTVPITRVRAVAGMHPTAFSGAAIAGREEPMVRVLTRPLGPGVHAFAFKSAHAETGVAAAGISPTASVYLETAPPEAVEVVCDELLVGGKLRFAFAQRVYD